MHFAFFLEYIDPDQQKFPVLFRSERGMVNFDGRYYLKFDWVFNLELGIAILGHSFGNNPWDLYFMSFPCL